MLETARQPKWLALLGLALVLVTVFVVMSAWQFGEARSEPTPGSTDTETAQPMTELFEPEESMTINEADHIVDLSGDFLEETQVLIADRLQGEEEREGYWVVTAFQVSGAPAQEVIPVVRGWVQEPEQAGTAPSGEIQLEGRLLPTEAPGPGPREVPEGQLPTLSVAELINLWDVASYSGFVVDFSGEAMSSAEESAGDMESVWVGLQPETSDINYLNLFYGVEWTLFAAFAFYLWWRLVKDAHLRELEEKRLDEEWAQQWRASQIQQRREDAQLAETKESS